MYKVYHVDEHSTPLTVTVASQHTSDMPNGGGGNALALALKRGKYRTSDPAVLAALIRGGVDIH